MARSRDEHVVFAADGDIVVVPVALIGASPPVSVPVLLRIDVLTI